MMYKRPFDIFVSLAALLILSPVMAVSWIAAAIDTKSSGFFTQKRIGRYGKRYSIIKLRTMSKSLPKRISRFGAFLRESKIDELPQLFNVLAGQMSIVGPRPDIAGYYDRLQGEARKVLEMRPGITSAASVKYRDEEILLSKLENPLQYNDEVIFPDKVRMNLEYYYNRGLWQDMKIIIDTIKGYLNTGRDA